MIILIIIKVSFRSAFLCVWSFCWRLKSIYIWIPQNAFQSDTRMRQIMKKGGITSTSKIGFFSSLLFCASCWFAMWISASYINMAQKERKSKRESKRVLVGKGKFMCVINVLIWATRHFFCSLFFISPRTCCNFHVDAGEKHTHLKGKKVRKLSSLTALSAFLVFFNSSEQKRVISRTLCDF